MHWRCCRKEISRIEKKKKLKALKNLLLTQHFLISWLLYHHENEEKQNQPLIWKSGNICVCQENLWNIQRDWCYVRFFAFFFANWVFKVYCDDVMSCSCRYTLSIHLSSTSNCATFRLKFQNLMNIIFTSGSNLLIFYMTRIFTFAVSGLRILSQLVCHAASFIPLYKYWDFEVGVNLYVGISLCQFLLCWSGVVFFSVMSLSSRKIRQRARLICAFAVLNNRLIIFTNCQQIIMHAQLLNHICTDILKVKDNCFHCMGQFKRYLESSSVFSSMLLWSKFEGSGSLFSAGDAF